jgi:uncharacterized protein (DUF885 family)
VNEFEKVATEFLEGYWRLHPVEATDAGINRYDAKLPDWSIEGQAELREWRERSRAAFQALPDNNLTAEQPLDKKVALAELAYSEIEEAWQYAQRAPAFYVQQAMNGLNILLVRPDETLSQAEREFNLAARLEAIGTLLEQGMANLDSRLVPPEYIPIGQVAVRGAIGFISGLELPESMHPSRQKTLATLAEYADFIEKIEPQGHFATGTEIFERILREYHGLDLSPAELYALGEETLSAVQVRLIQQAKEIDPDRTWSEIVEGLKADHPTREGLLQAYAAEADCARAFVEAKNLVTIPAGDVFEVRPTAPFLRATSPLGHFDKTPPFAAHDNLGVLYITPIDPTLPETKQDELLSAHCHTAIKAICLHETYPGHHLQLWIAKLKGTPIRRQFHSTLYAEGWALYCEELMEETGYLATPELKLWQLKNSMWRAVRIMIDVGLHSGKLDLNSAAQLLTAKAGLEPNTALGEVRRYTTSPTQPSSYMLGRNRVVQLRRQYETKTGDNFNLREFHDKFLSYSSVSPAFIPDALSE